jgi:hypothetical protein
LVKCGTQKLLSCSHLALQLPNQRQPPDLACRWSAQLSAARPDASDSDSLPQLRNFGAYPTTIFSDRHGRVRLIHAGFTGPATGRLEEVSQTFERTVVALLDEQ